MFDHCYPPEHLVFMLDTQYLIIGHTKNRWKGGAPGTSPRGKGNGRIIFSFQTPTSPLRICGIRKWSGSRLQQCSWKVGSIEIKKPTYISILSVNQLWN